MGPTIIGRHFSVFYPEDAIASGFPEYELFVATAEGRFQGEGWRLRNDGSRFWANVVITALRGPGGELAGFGKVTQDLTAKRAAEQDLLESNARATSLAMELARANSYLTNVYDASVFISIIATNLKGHITIFNRGAELMLGYTAAEVIGKETPARFHLKEELEERGQSLSRLLGRPVHGFEVFTASIGVPSHDHLDWSYVRKDGQRLTVQLSLSVICGVDGKRIGYLGVAEDITERQRAANELKSAYEQVNSILEWTSDSVMTIAHDWTLLYANRKTIESLPEFKVGENYWSCFPAIIGTPTEMKLRVAMEQRTETTYEIYYAPHKVWFRVHGFPTSGG
jgi:PAS domain S-box-containing protein